MKYWFKNYRNLSNIETDFILLIFQNKWPFLHHPVPRPSRCVYVCVCICTPPVLCADEAPVRSCVDVCNLIMPYTARTPEAHRLCITVVQRVQTRFLRARKTSVSKRPLNVPIASKNCFFQVIGRHRFPWTLSHPVAHLTRLHLHGSTVPPPGGTGPFL